MPVGMQEMVAPPELMLAQMTYAGVDHCVLQAGGSYGAMTEMNAFAQLQYPGRMTGLMHVDEAMAGTECELAKVDHAFEVLKLRGLYFNVESMSRHGFPWPLDAKEMAPFWDKLARRGIVLCLELSSAPTYDAAGYMGHIVALRRILERHRDLKVHLAMSPPVAFFAKKRSLRVPEDLRTVYRHDRLMLEVMFPITYGGVWDYPYPEAQALIESLRGQLGAERPDVGLRHAQRRALLHLPAIARLRAEILPVPDGAREGPDPGRQLRPVLRHPARSPIMTTRATLRQQGEALRQRLFGDDDGAPAVMRTLNVEASYGAIWSRPGLALEDRMICALAALAAVQRLPKLRRHVGAALHLGLDAPRDCRGADPDRHLRRVRGLGRGGRGRRYRVRRPSGRHAGGAGTHRLPGSPERAGPQADGAAARRSCRAGLRRAWQCRDRRALSARHSVWLRRDLVPAWPGPSATRAGGGGAFTALKLGQVQKFGESALNMGLSRTEVIEAVIQTAPLSGFAPALNALGALSGVLGGK
jgi:alkylhydroperoxidase/carboxymuconolactone decarboxylase family protein YurZ